MQPSNLFCLMSSEYDIQLLTTEEADITRAVLRDIMPLIAGRSEADIRKAFGISDETTNND